ncbi:Gp49 family protein [Moraxella atlantae]|uniref:Gp49 family protein n=1 Tax=Faucicola atlantae TaxID=34059 RepID=UPI003752C129
MKNYKYKLGIISAMALVAALPERKLTKEFLESEIDKVEYNRFNKTLTHCTITTKSGFSFTGESACVDPNNFDEVVGRHFAYEQAFDKMWLPYGFWLHKALAEFDNFQTSTGQDEFLAEGLKQLCQSNMLPKTGQLSFGDAVNALKEGCRVCRAGWNGKGMFLSLVKGRDTDYHVNSEVFGTGNDGNSQDQLPVLDAIYMKTADNKLVPWLASQTDVLADDWQIIE